MRNLIHILTLIIAICYGCWAIGSIPQDYFEYQDLDELQERGFITINKTNLINSINFNKGDFASKIETLFNTTSRNKQSIIETGIAIVSNVTGLSTTVITPLLACVIGIPLLTFGAYCALLFIFPDPLSDSKFERDVSVVVRHIGRMVSSVEDNFFDFLEDMTDPQEQIPPAGYGFNKNKFMTVKKRPKDSYSSAQNIRNSYEVGLPYLAFANVRSDSHESEEMNLKDLLKESSFQEPNYFNPKYKSVPINTNNIPNYYSTQQHHNYLQKYMQHNTLRQQYQTMMNNQQYNPQVQNTRYQNQQLYRHSQQNTEPYYDELNEPATPNPLTNHLKNQKFSRHEQLSDEHILRQQLLSSKDTFFPSSAFEQESRYPDQHRIPYKVQSTNKDYNKILKKEDTYDKTSKDSINKNNSFSASLVHKQINKNFGKHFNHILDHSSKVSSRNEERKTINLAKPKSNELTYVFPRSFISLNSVTPKLTNEGLPFKTNRRDL